MRPLDNGDLVLAWSANNPPSVAAVARVGQDGQPIWRTNLEPGAQLVELTVQTDTIIVGTRTETAGSITAFDAVTGEPKWSDSTVTPLLVLSNDSTAEVATVHGIELLLCD